MSSNRAIVFSVFGPLLVDAFLSSLAGSDGLFKIRNPCFGYERSPLCLGFPLGMLWIIASPIFSVPPVLVVVEWTTTPSQTPIQGK